LTDYLKKFLEIIQEKFIKIPNSKDLSFTLIPEGAT